MDVRSTFDKKDFDQGRLNARSLAQRPHEHRAPMLIYVCCDLPSINNYYPILKHLLLYYKWTLAFAYHGHLCNLTCMYVSRYRWLCR